LYNDLFRQSLLSVADFRDEARRSLPKFVFDFIDGGSEDEICLVRNLKDLRSVTLIPRHLRNTQAVDCSVSVFGQRWAVPVGIAPLGLTGLVRPHGDLMLARAATEIGVPFVLSTASNTSLERVREAFPKCILWQQLYVMSDRSMAEQLIHRAKKAGIDALVLTIDVPVSGLRQRDLRNHFAAPFKLTPRIVAGSLRHPRWLYRMLRDGLPTFANLALEPHNQGGAGTKAAMLAREMDRGLTWENIPWLRKLWNGPLLIKGVLHPEDAKLAMRYGIDGLIVSNHGGRQLDAAPSSIAALPRIAEAVASKIPILVDSGFRNGTDVVRALATGAQAVLIGRAPLFGLASGGVDGIRAILKIFEEDIERNMILLGAANVSQIGRHNLATKSDIF
jgi:(S)-mandelate dehydrogenase